MNFAVRFGFFVDLPYLVAKLSYMTFEKNVYWPKPPKMQVSGPRPLEPFRKFQFPVPATPDNLGSSRTGWLITPPPRTQTKYFLGFWPVLGPETSPDGPGSFRDSGPNSPNVFFQN